MYEWEFSVLRVPSEADKDGDFHLFGKGPDHCTPMRKINEAVGKPVVALCGGGFGVNLKIADMQAWSDYVSMHIGEVEGNNFVLQLPEGSLEKRED
jgi:hypothetical protein